MDSKRRLCQETTLNPAEYNRDPRLFSQCHQGWLHPLRRNPPLHTISVTDITGRLVCPKLIFIVTLTVHLLDNYLLCKSNQDFMIYLMTPVPCYFAKCSPHGTNILLPSKKMTHYILRNSETSYVLPHCSLDVFKCSFINWCLYTL